MTPADRHRHCWYSAHFVISCVADAADAADVAGAADAVVCDGPHSLLKI